VNSELKILSELFVEFLVIFRVFRNFLDQFEAFLGNVLLDNLQDLVVLEEFSTDVQG